MKNEILTGMKNSSKYLFKCEGSSKSYYVPVKDEIVNGCCYNKIKMYKNECYFLSTELKFYKRNRIWHNLKYRMECIKPSEMEHEAQSF